MTVRTKHKNETALSVRRKGHSATPEELMESGAINGEAYGLWRKLAKVEA